MKTVDVEWDDPTRRLEPHQSMAQAITDITKVKGGCLPQDLMKRGFTPDEVAELWPMANALASLMME